MKHWWMQRMTALPLIPLFFYFIGQMKFLTTHDRAIFTAWAQQPLPSAALTVFIICSFYHAALGVDEIVEDYVSGEAKTLSQRVNKTVFLLLGAACLYAVIKIYNGRPS